jgi:hypothetical protein
MGFKTTITTQHDYPFIITSGCYNYAELCDLIDKAATKIKSGSWVNLCVDILDVTGTISNEDRFNLGIYASKRIMGPVSIAIIYRSSEINKLFEHVDWNDGVRVAIVSSRQEALCWLELQR